MTDDAGRPITVSRDALRADLLDLELRLVEKLASKDDVHAVVKDVAHLETRVDLLEASETRRTTREDAVEATFSRREKLGGLAIALVALLLNLAINLGVHG